MKAIIITVVAVGVIYGVAGYLGGRMPAHYPVSPDAQSFSEDKQTKLERIFGVRSAKYTEALSKAERKTLSQSQGYSKIEREIQYPDAERIAVESENTKDAVRKETLQSASLETPLENKEDIAVPAGGHSARAEVKQVLQDGETAEKQNLRSLQTDVGPKTNKDASVTTAKALDSVEKSSDNKYARAEANIEGNTISGQRVIESSSRQVNSRTNSNYEKNFNRISQDIIPLPSPQVYSKNQMQIVFMRVYSKGKSEKKKVKVIISGIDYSIPITSLTYGNLNSLRNKLSNK